MGFVPCRLKANIKRTASLFYELKKYNFKILNIK